MNTANCGNSHKKPLLKSETIRIKSMVLKTGEAIEKPNLN